MIGGGRSSNALRLEDRAASRSFASSKLVIVSIQRGGPASLTLLKMSFAVSVSFTQNQTWADDIQRRNLSPRRGTGLSQKGHSWPVPLLSYFIKAPALEHPSVRTVGHIVTQTGIPGFDCFFLAKRAVSDSIQGR